MASAPALNKGRSRRISCPVVWRPAKRAAAMVAIGVIDRALATAPIRAEYIRLRISIFVNSHASESFSNLQVRLNLANQVTRQTALLGTSRSDRSLYYSYCAVVPQIVSPPTRLGGSERPRSGLYQPIADDPPCQQHHDTFVSLPAKLADRRQCVEPAVQSARARSGLRQLYHLHPCRRRMAVFGHRIGPVCAQGGRLFHGAEHVSELYQDLLAQRGLVCSMSRKGGGSPVSATDCAGSTPSRH